MKGIVVYKGKYGATEQYAKWIGNSLRIPVYEEEDVNSIKLSEFDYVISGSSIYAGKLQLRKWLAAQKHILAGKKLFLFIVCGTPPQQQDEADRLLSANIDKALLNTMNVFFLRGRMIKAKLSLRDRAILSLGAAMQRNKADKEKMLADFDDVKKEHLDELIRTVKPFAEFASA